jgi:hypothetical protein
MALRQNNARCVNAAVVKVNRVLANAFSDLTDMQGKGEQFFAPKFVKHLLGFCFDREEIIWHWKRSLYTAANHYNQVNPEMQDFWHQHEG